MPSEDGVTNLSFRPVACDGEFGKAFQKWVGFRVGMGSFDDSGYTVIPRTPMFLISRESAQPRYQLVQNAVDVLIIQWFPKQIHISKIELGLF